MKSIFYKKNKLVGVGKTTIVKKVMDVLQKESHTVAGFYTKEERSQITNKRIGFDIVRFSREREVLARLFRPALLELPKVAQYFVYIESFEKLALDEVRKRHEGLLVLDEIGKMELLSREFAREVERLVETLEKGGKSVKLVATVPLNSQLPIIVRLKSVPNVRIFNVTKENRNAMYEEILEEVRELANS